MENQTKTMILWTWFDKGGSNYSFTCRNTGEDLTDNQIVNGGVTMVVNKHMCQSMRNRRVRRMVRLFGPYCAYCNKFMIKGDLTIDHAIPVFRGGHKTCAQNLLLACYACNMRKGAKDVFEYAP